MEGKPANVMIAMRSIQGRGKGFPWEMLYLALFPTLILLGGCSTSNIHQYGSAPGCPVFAEWHSVERAYHLEPLYEDVLVRRDGSVDVQIRTEGFLKDLKEFAPKRRQWRLTPDLMDQLKGLINDWESLTRRHLLSGHICPEEPRTPNFTQEIMVVYCPDPGVRKELRRTWGTGEVDPFVLSGESFERLKSLDAFFQNLLWKD
jgi:hypothetical protein